MKHYQILIADKFTGRDLSKHEFVAEFADEELTKRYVAYMRKKARYAEKDIFVKEVDFNGDYPSGRFVGVLFVTGEGLFQDEIDAMFNQ